MSSNSQEPQSSLQNLNNEKYQDLDIPNSNDVMKITINDIRNFGVAFTTAVPINSSIRSIDFSPNGFVGLFNTQDILSSVTLNSEYPNEKKPVKTGKFGCEIAKFFNDESKAILSCAKDSNDIQLFDIPSNTFCQCYKGHKNEVTSIGIPKEYSTNFISSSKDNSVRFWDSREKTHRSSRVFLYRPIAAFHPFYQEIAVAYLIGRTSYAIEIIDIRKFEGDLKIAKFLVQDQDFKWMAMKYSNNGKYLMINTNDTLTIVLDAEKGHILHRLVGYSNPNHTSIETCFTPDSNFILGGSEDGKVHVWDVKTSEKEEILSKPIAGSTGKIIFNPVFMCFATAGEKYHLWIEK